MTPNIENNPLNTGNGAPQGSNPVTSVTAPIAPKPTAVPTPVPPTPPVTSPTTLTQQQVVAATTAQTSAENIVSGTSKILQFKKYIIAGIVGIIFLTIIYVAYSFFSSPSEEIATEENPTTEVELTNSLSTDSSESTNPEDTAELEKVVNDLKDQYKDENSNPPGISIVIPETSTPTDTDTTPPTDSGSSTTPPADSGSDTTPPADSEEVVR